MKAKKKNKMKVEKVNYNTGLMMMITNKEWVRIMRRHIHRTTQMTAANKLSIQ